MFHWPLLSTVFGVVANFFFLSIVAVFSWFAYVLRSNDEFVSQSQKNWLSGKISIGENETVLLVTFATVFKSSALSYSCITSYFIGL